MTSTSECSQDGKCVPFMDVYAWNMYHNSIGSILLTCPIDFVMVVQEVMSLIM